LSSIFHDVKLRKNPDGSVKCGRKEDTREGRRDSLGLPNSSISHERGTKEGTPEGRRESLCLRNGPIRREHALMEKVYFASLTIVKVNFSSLNDLPNCFSR
jgi:hypothetical protein